MATLQRSAAQVLPQMLHYSDNSNGAMRSARGYQFPPFVVLERGLPLTNWLRARRHMMEAVGMVEALAALLATLHAKSKVHRDIKPDNILMLQHSASWCLLDMGIVADIGASLHLGT
jgi:serine/threonine protein kinase